jgi:two-component system sensor histidine kinase KdpD
LTDERDIRRPDPDALLALAEQGQRGRLLVFIGAAPGVGKTYAMLARAQRLKQEGVDIVVGLVETHGRVETDGLLRGLEILPRRVIETQGRRFEEFDLDGALRRRPKLIIVDELAHSNAPECRHPKRWQDVEELLDAKIDVWTALNVQHLESLADVVSRVTGVTVRETVPDIVLRDADDLILVDITAEELITRLQEGKVYLPETAKVASQKFFTRRNLTALRELALRRTAARVDDLMVEQLRQSAIQGPWGSSERILVCVGPDRRSLDVVRAASRLATALNADWCAAHVRRSGLDETQAGGADEALTLARSLGATVERLDGRDRATEILAYARRENFTQIVIGRSPRPRWRRFQPSLAEQLARDARVVDVHVITGGEVETKPSRRWLARLLRRPRSADWLGLVAAAGSVAGAVGVGKALTWWIPLPNLSMIFLAAVLISAVQFGVRPAIAAAILSFFADDFFFIPPLYQFTIAEPQEFFSLIVFVAVAALTGWLAGRAKDQELLAQESERATQSLFELSRRLSGAVSLDSIFETAAVYVQKTLKAEAVVMLLPENGELSVASAWPPFDSLNPGEIGAARWALEKREAAGWRTGTLPNVRFQFRPLTTARGVIAVCGFAPAAREAPLPPTPDHTLNLILDQTAVALDRAVLAREALRTSSLEANEKLRSTLLASLSHDLRTPLASIVGAVTTLQQFEDTLSLERRRDLLHAIEEEAGRLSRFIANLLDMSRIDAGALKPKQEILDISEVVQAAVERARKTFPARTFQTSLARDLPFAEGDPALVEQVLFNLLDNAQKYGGERPILIHARAVGKEAIVSVTDDGPGIKPSDLERIFEKFYQGGKADGRKIGVGLGLSIARGLIEAMGGRIWAESPAMRRRGARLLIALPLAKESK